ncbi:MAG TPA: imidazole glycerol phosphate synthase subunit HisH [Sphingomicrobium sp.]|nr:imidazole glycerol phosphate synthase subunit HisH [Sphingomicrobium sp.]
MTALAVLDLGYGNTDSVRLAFQRLGVEAELTADPITAEQADRVVLPGVGSAGFAMSKLRDAGLVDILKRRTKPLLGICLGMQLMFDFSDESELLCLGLIPGRVRAMSPTRDLPVPHMGWTKIEEAAPGIGLWKGDYVYFAHGFVCEDGPATAARVTYGASISAAIRAGPLWGAQFHPERSSAAGASFLKAFLAS